MAPMVVNSVGRISGRRQERQKWLEKSKEGKRKGKAAVCEGREYKAMTLRLPNTAGW